MKLNERIEQSIRFGVKEIKIREEVYNKLSEETKRLLKLNNVKITFDDSVKEFQSIFQEELMTRNQLVEYCDLKKEIEDLEKRIDRIHKTSEMVSDTVQNGYKHRAVIYGVDLKRKRKLNMYENKLQEFYDKLFEEQNQIEDYIETIPQSNIRQIFRYRYIDGFSWNQIQILMEYKHEDTARRKHDRFLEKNL